MGEDEDLDLESLTLDAAILRSHKSLSNILSRPNSGAPTPSSGLFAANPNPPSSTLSTSSNASSSSSLRVPNDHHVNGHLALASRKSNSNLRGSMFTNAPGERISFMDWSPPSSTASSLYGDDELYDPNEFAHAPRIHPRASEVPPDNTSGSLFPSPSFNPSGPPHPAPSSELTPSFWLVADPNANPLARVGADVPLPSPEDEEIDMVIIGSGITGVSFLLNAVKTLMKQTPEDEVNDNGGESKKPFKIVMLEARDFCSGATGRNGGHLTPSIFDDFVDRTNYPILDAVDDAIRVSLLEEHTISSLRDLIHERGWAQDIDFVENGHVKMFGAEGIEEGRKEEEESRKDWEAAKQAGVPESIIGKVRWIGADEMREKYGTKEGGGATGCWFPAANVWPIKLVTKMFQLAEEMTSNSSTSSSSNASPVSIRLFTHTLVTSVTPFSPPPSPSVDPSTLGPNTSQGFSAPARWTVHTQRGEIKARYVVHATNAYASYLLPQFAPPASTPPAPPSSAAIDGLDPSSTSTVPSDSHHLSASIPLPASKPRALWIQPTRGQVIATRAANLSPYELWKPGPSWLANRGWEYWFPRYWFPRPPSLLSGVEEKEKAMVILGGARDCASGPNDGGENRNPLETGITDDSTLNPHISDALHAFLPEVFPGLFDVGSEPEYEWTGIMGYTKTLDPMVGPVPSPAHSTTSQQLVSTQKYLPGQFIAAGYSGHGMPRAYSCAEALVQMVFADMSKDRNPTSGGLDWEEWKREERPDWLPASYLTF